MMSRFLNFRARFLFCLNYNLKTKIMKFYSKIQEHALCNIRFVNKINVQKNLSALKTNADPDTRAIATWLTQIFPG